MDLTNLASFVRVADAQSFAAAAREMGVPTSTLTRRVQRLEEELATELLRRSGRSFALTRSGKKLHALVAESVYVLGSAQRSFADADDQPSGLLRLTAPADLGGSAPFARLLAGFSAAFPGVRLELTLGSRNLDLAAEDVDIGFRAGPTGPPAGNGLMCRQIIVQLEGGIYASPEYLQQHGVPETVEELADHTWIAHSVAKRLGVVRDGGGREVLLRPRIEVNDYGAVKELLLAGAGAGFLPGFSAPEDASDPRLVRLLPDVATPRGSLWLVWLESRHIAPRVRAFIDYVMSDREFLHEVPLRNESR